VVATVVGSVVLVVEVVVVVVSMMSRSMFDT
jgi:hypothetical protein